MTPDIDDLFTKVGQSPSLTGLDDDYTAGAGSITPTSVANWPDDTAVFFAMRRVQTVNNEAVLLPNTYTEWKGTVEAGSVTNMQLVNGSDQNYPADSTTQVYISVIPSQMNALITGLLVSHNKDGVIKDGAISDTDMFGDGVVDTAALATNAVETDKVANGAITPQKMLGVDLFGRNNAVIGSPIPAAGTGQFYMQAGTDVGTFASNAFEITFPTPFPNGVVTVVLVDGDDVGGNNMSVSQANTTVNKFRAQSASNGIRRVNWIAIGW